MTRALSSFLCVWLLVPSLARAEEPASDDPRANDAAHEPVCASASKAWSDGLLKWLRREIEAHGLPAGKKPK